MTTEDTGLRLLYLGGWGRSGSTILGQLLGSHAGVVHVGETWHLWEDMAVDTAAPCSCRRRYLDCPFWQAVFAEAGIDLEVAARMRAIKARFLGTRQLFLKPTAFKPENLAPDLKAYRDTLERLYAAIAKVSGARVVVDASKTPNTIALMPGMTVVKPHVLHLVRDPRAVAYSWYYRQKAKGPDAAAGVMARHNPVRSTLSWASRNRMVERLARQGGLPYQCLRYEDFAADPEPRIAEAFALMGMERPPLVPDAEAGESHSVRGNAVRFSEAPARISPDERWKSEMPAMARELVRLSAGSALRKYGYAGDRA